MSAIDQKITRQTHTRTSPVQEQPKLKPNPNSNPTPTQAAQAPSLQWLSNCAQRALLPWHNFAANQNQNGAYFISFFLSWKHKNSRGFWGRDLVRALCACVCECVLPFFVVRCGQRIFEHWAKMLVFFLPALKLYYCMNWNTKLHKMAF